MYSYFKIT